MGNLTLEALPHHWYTIGGSLLLLLLTLFLIVQLTKKQKWQWLWDEWLTSVDPKKIGTMYLIVASLMLLRGLLDSAMIWAQQAINSTNLLDANHFQEITTSHGDIMVFFVTMGFFFGLMNWMVPLQIGARDLAFPFVNSLSFWLYAMGAILMNFFFLIGGHFADTGWLAIAPLSELEFNPGAGVDYLIWSLQLSGLGTLLSGINFLVTILKKRATGMTLLKMPLFTWTSLCSSVLIISAFPVLTATLFLLWLDRFFGMHFFTSDLGGNQMLYFNFIWMWGHPEVYILILPAFGMFSEIVATFSKQKISGYLSMVSAAIAITLLSFLVWLHHFFTMGAGANVNAFFGITTMLIAIPTGVQIFNWILTMYRGDVVFKTPMLWFMGFVCTFTLGGMVGVLMASPPADFQIHNSLFLVAHFHTMVIGGALFGIFAGISYWFPKFTGYILNERLGKLAFWLWLIGFYISFLPLYLLGLMGTTRRLDHYDPNTGYQPLFIVSCIGFCIIIAAIIVQIIQVIITFKESLSDTTGDPWDGRTLEWATSSPPPAHNFSHLPLITTRDAFWEMKQHPQKDMPPEPIHLPPNTGAGLIISLWGFILAFALIWHIYWLIILSLIAIVICVMRLQRNINVLTD